MNIIYTNYLKVSFFSSFNCFKIKGHIQYFHLQFQQLATILESNWNLRWYHFPPHRCRMNSVFMVMHSCFVIHVCVTYIICVKFEFASHKAVPFHWSVLDILSCFALSLQLLVIVRLIKSQQLICWHLNSPLSGVFVVLNRRPKTILYAAVNTAI